MEKEIHEQYEYARRRIKQKKTSLFSFCSFCYRKFAAVYNQPII